MARQALLMVLLQMQSLIILGGLAIDQKGNIYVADEGNNRIRLITTAGLVSTLAGNGTAGFGDGTGINAEFNVTNNISTDAQGNVYVPDENNERIRKISAQGTVITIAGNGIQGNANGLANTAEFNGPSAVCVDAQGNVYVSDQFNNIIRKITVAGVVSTLAGTEFKVMQMEWPQMLNLMVLEGWLLTHKGMFM